MPDEHRQQKMSGMNARPTESVIAPYLNGERPSEKKRKTRFGCTEVVLSDGLSLFYKQTPVRSQKPRAWLAPHTLSERQEAV